MRGCQSKCRMQGRLSDETASRYERGLEEMRRDDSILMRAKTQDAAGQWRWLIEGG
jgi:hypothetical protein